jgi:hypothetical protein
MTEKLFDEVESDAVAALSRLVKIEREGGDSDTAQTVRRLILGLENGPAWPFDLQQLTPLNDENYADVIAVIDLATWAKAPPMNSYVGDAMIAEFERRETEV